MHIFGCLLVAATLPADVPGNPNSFEIEEPDFVIATAGLRPFTQETNYLLLKDYWRRFHHPVLSATPSPFSTLRQVVQDSLPR